MNYTIEHFSLKGEAAINEDALILNHTSSIYGVLDGATSVISFKNDKGETGGYLAANIVREHFEQLNKNADLKYELVEANKKIKERMLHEGVNVGEKERLWATAAAVVVIRERDVDYAQIADCMIYAVYSDGRTETVTPDGIAHIDQKSMNKWREGIDKGLKTKQQLREYITPTLVENRKLCNVDGGYGALNGALEAEKFITFGSLDCKNLTALVILSDGLTTCYTDGQEHASVEAILKHGLEQYAYSLQNLEEEDPHCMKYIRLKMSDDKTGIVIRFK